MPNNNLRNVYDLMDKLCRKFSPDHHKDILKKVTGGIADTQQHFFSTSWQFDESILVSKIKDHLAAKKEENLSVFVNHYQELVTLTQPKFRSSILTFLLFLSDMESKLPSTARFDDNRDSTESVFMLPVRPKTIEASSSMQEIHRGVAPRNASTNSLNSENNLRLPINYRRRIPASVSSDSVLCGQQTPDSEYSFNLSLNEELVQEAIHAVTGRTGKYLKKDVTGEFKLDIKARNLSSFDVMSLRRFSEIGLLHNKIQKFTDSNSEYFLCGLFGQGLISQVESELVQFYGLIAHMQDNLHIQRSNYMNEGDREQLTLLSLHSAFSESSKRLKIINEILQACKGLKGGPLISTVYEFLYNGNPTCKNITEQFLKAVCRPVQNMMSHWLIDGEICDPHREFFIEEISEVSSDRLWHHKYRIVNSRLPSFISKQLAKKILVSGKSINFLREVCEDRTPIKGREELKLAFENNSDDIYNETQDTKLHEMIDQVYLSTSKKVLDIALGQYRLLEHLQAMRKYLLLGQGDFINVLMENLKDELDRPAKDLYQHHLFSIVAASVRCTNQFDDSILQHLDVKLVLATDGDRGWDIFTLQYSVRGPLATILELNMGKYQELFKPLWKAKHTEFVLDNIWKEQILEAKRLAAVWPELSPIFYRLHSITAEMVHFVHQMQYYILFEVIECSWANFIKKVQSAKALDDILEAHEDFLSTVRVGCFLDLETKQTLFIHLDIIYNSIMRLEGWQKDFYEVINKETEAVKDYEKKIILSEKLGEYGVTTEEKLDREQNKKLFENSVNLLRKQLDEIGNCCANYVNDFLLMLTSSKDPNLTRFGIRLDFNEYYKRKDQRLKQTLTYEHMRLSGIGTSGVFSRSFMDRSITKLH